MLLKVVRNGLGQTIILADFVSRPRRLQRSAEAQAGVKRALRNLSLYQSRTCPFCVKTRRAIHRLDLLMRLKDVMNDPQAHQALLEGGDKVKVSCLRIEENGQVHWICESSEIIAYLEGCFINARTADQRSPAAPRGSRWIRKCVDTSPSRPGNRRWRMRDSLT